jgi:uncharacterized MAPEG superfamily protein
MALESLTPLTPDLLCLLILALWGFFLNHIPAIARAQNADLKWAMGNRDTQPPVPAWVGRADRAQRNHHDNLAMIAVVILLAAITGKADGITAIASIVLVVARVLHGVVYMVGIPLARSVAYLVGFLSLLVIVWRILA